MSASASASPHAKTPGISLKPVIEEIIRTRLFDKPITLLVDRIHVVPYKSEEDDTEAYRLWLSDSHKALQAVLVPEIHPFVRSKEICNGSIVLLRKYRLEEAKRLKGVGKVLYLVVEDVEAIGHDGRESLPLTFEEARAITDISPEKDAEEPSNVFARLDSSKEEASKETTEPPCDEGPLAHKRLLDELSPPPSPSRPKVRKVTFQDEGGSNATSFSRPKTASGLPARPSSSQPMLPRSGTQPAPANEYGSRPVNRPLSLTTLAKLTGPPHVVVRNRVVDVLAVIVEVSPNIITRNHLSHLDLPPSRNLRIMDPSIPKKVQLTVFVDVDSFTPTVGTVALFRSVTTHEWDGGSLKAYPRDCKGRDWYIPWPWNIEGCDVKAMKNWWDARVLAGLNT